MVVNNNKKTQKYWTNLVKKEEKLGDIANACKKKMCETEELRKERANLDRETKLKCDGIKEGYAKCSDPIYEKSKYYKLFEEYSKCSLKPDVCVKERAARKKVNVELNAYYMTPEGNAFLMKSLKDLGFNDAANNIAKANKKGGEKNTQIYWDRLQQEESHLADIHNACKKKMCETEEMRKERIKLHEEYKLKCGDENLDGYAECTNPIYAQSKYKKLFEEYGECGKRDNVCKKERETRKIKSTELNAFYMTPEGQAYMRNQIKAIEMKEAAEAAAAVAVAAAAAKNKKGGGSYKITNYTYKQAKRLGVVVKPSLDKTKKIDVYRTSKTGTDKKNNKTMKKIASVGANGMNDFPTYIQKKGLTFAKTRRRLYKMRHEKDRKTKWSRGWLADKLLW